MVTGMVAGMALQLDWWAARGWFGPLGSLSSLTRLVAVGSIGATILFGMRGSARWIVRRLPLPPVVTSGYPRFDSAAYWVFLLLLLGAIGIQVSIPFLYAVALLFLASQVSVLLLLLRKDERGYFFASPAWPSLLFLVSGVAALIYQIVWQRVLFAAYGVNIESVTIIVSVFMFGLGVGSLVGGMLTRRFPSHLLLLFVICEAAIGCFGVASLPLIRWVTEATVYGSLLTLSLVSYALLCLPTIFMGATLPILVGYLHGHNHHIGKSVGVLYCLNTLGSALASLLTVDVLFRFLGQQSTVFIAAAFNFLVAGLAFAYGWRRSRRPESTDRIAGALPGVEIKERAHSISYALTLWLAAGAGFVSLSQEILWVRAISLASGGIPHVFGHVLGFFLLGVAAGALLGKNVCDRNRIHPLLFIAIMFLATGVFYYLAIPLTSTVIAISWEAGMLVTYLAVAVAAFLLGGVLPVLCHFGSRPATPVGVSLSRIYMANILGSTAGPLLTGFVLLNRWTLEQNILFLSMLCLIVGCGVLTFLPLTPRLRLSAVGIVAVLLTLQTTWHQALYQRVLERLHSDMVVPKIEGYSRVIQNRSGIIATVPSEQGDIVFGGGVYDGRFNVDPVRDSNLIKRAYLVAALHPDPQEVLEIGLSTGSWSWVLAAHESVRSLTVVEINPGYLQLVSDYPEQRTLLANPKFHFYLDDGRRWLKRHPDARFDVIVMNTTFHWRSNATNLLSREFLEDCRSHLKEGGLLMYNATGSVNNYRTAAEVFKHVTHYRNLIVAGDRPWVVNADELRGNLLRFRVGDRLLLDSQQPETRSVLEELAASVLPEMGDDLRRRTDLQVITDDNMLTEFKKSSSRIGQFYRCYNPRKAWGLFYF
jgi:spermidine synthase